MDLQRATGFLRAHQRGVLVTRRRSGGPQLSNISYAVDDNGVVRISVTADRAKTRNLRRDQRASLHVTSPDFWQWAVVDGTAELSAVSAAPDDEAVEELVTYYRSVRGEEHPDWDEYRQAMVAERRLVVRLRPSHAYGQLPS